jgi:predicted AAA+ superfamily ATPase
MSLEKIFEIQRVVLESFERLTFYPRTIFETFSFEHPICGVVGPRGVGKTTLLLRQAIKAGAKQQRALYVSADNVFFLEMPLLELVDKLYKETDVRLLCIDEIHKYPNWNQILKNISDTYLDFKIIFSGSSTIDLIKSKYDLSRRVVLYHLYGFSFREYLNFNLDISLPKCTLKNLTTDTLTVMQEINAPKILKYFNDYLMLGYYPFLHRMTEPLEKFQTIENLIQKTIYEDIATLHAMKTPTLMVLEQLFKFIINSAPGELNAYKLSRNLGKDFENITEYLALLQQAGLIRFLYAQKSGLAALRNPIKMYPDNTNMIYALQLPLTQASMIGKIRETFVINQLQNSGEEVYYSERGDFKIKDMLFEIGGKNKSDSQIKDHQNAFILADGILSPGPKTIPLFLLGLLY